jgi:dipeptidyl aminopeptidase/acylaminoacyl peptidase
MLRRLSLIGLMVLCTAAFAAVPSLAAQGGTSPSLSVIAEALNVRSGPGIAYAAIDVLLHGDQVAIIGQDTPSGWWQVRLSDGRSGWVSGGAAYVRVSGDTSGVPFIETSAQADTTTAAPSAATTVGPPERGTLVFQTASGGPIYAINADGSNLHYLTTGLDPAISPDGRQVAFTRWEDSQNGSPGSLWTINIDGTGERVILNDVRQPKGPTWSPDGSKIAISMQQGGRLSPEYKCSDSLPSDPLMADRDGDYFHVKVEVDQNGDVDAKVCYTLLPHPFWGLRMVNVDSGQFEDLPRSIFSYAPAWDPADPWRLVYEGDLGLVNLDLNQNTTWALNQDPRDRTPAFSPDGSRLAVSYYQNDHWDIHVMNADGSGRVRLTETPLRVLVDQQINGQEVRSWNNVAPVWSPDGSQIAFLTDRSGQWEIWVMPAPGTQAQVNADGSHQQPMFPAGTLGNLTLQYYNVGERALSWR